MPKTTKYARATYQAAIDAAWATFQAAINKEKEQDKNA